MLGLFKKKEKSTNLDPPLPDLIPPASNKKETIPLNNPSSQMNVPFPDNNFITNNINNTQQINTHDLIPNDIELRQKTLSPEDFSPENLPPFEDIPEQELKPTPGLFNESIPKNVEMKDLPEIPNLPEPKEIKPVETEKTQKKETKEIKKEPTPEIDEDVPIPPAIFSDDSFYETPEEIKHIVENRKKSAKKEEYIKKYDLDKEYKENKQDEEEIIYTKPNPTGPIFVDVESFKTMSEYIERIKNKIKASNDILQRLNDIKNSKDTQFERWRSSLEDLQRKINYIDKSIFKEA